MFSLPFDAIYIVETCSIAHVLTQKVINRLVKRQAIRLIS